MTDQSQSATAIRETLQRAIAAGQRAVIRYLDIRRLITPHRIADTSQGEILFARDETGGRDRRFRLEFIRSATIVQRKPPGRPREMDNAQRVTLYLDASMLAAVDSARVVGNSRVAWIREAIEQRLARDSA